MRYVVAELMTRQVVTVGVHAPYREVVAVMDRHRISALPVVDDRDRLVGIVSRGDLLRVFLRRDDEIEREVTEMVLGRPYVAGNVEVAARVEGGVVRLEGHARTRRDPETLVELVQEVDGVVAVESRVACMTPELGALPLRRR